MAQVAPVTLHGDECLITQTTCNPYPPTQGDLDGHWSSIRQHTKFGLTTQTACNSPPLKQKTKFIEAVILGENLRETYS